MPTIIVAVAVTAMIALGVWQLHRLAWKEALLSRYAAAAGEPPVALPAFGALDEGLLFRRASAFCLQPVSWQAEAGRAADGSSGWRHIAMCRTGAEGPGFAADMGISRDSADPAWRGGEVAGVLTTAPSDTSLLVTLFGHAPPPTPMIVAAAPAPGLAPSQRPDPADIPNNHLAYAVQWFVFAALAFVIYGIALRRREQAKPRS